MKTRDKRLICFFPDQVKWLKENCPNISEFIRRLVDKEINRGKYNE